MDEQQERLLLALLNGQARARENVESGVLQLLQQMILAMRGLWYDNKAVARFKSEAIDVVRQGQVAVGDTTGAYLDQVLDELGVTPPSKVPALPDRLRDVDRLIQWERPAKEYRRLRLLGATDDAAQDGADKRARTMASMDLSLAMRQAARQRIAPVDAITGYRRVIHPELSRSGSCGLCVVASDRIYSKRELLPLHDGCNCGVMTVTKTSDPGQSINQADLQRLYGAAGSTSRADLQRVRVKTVQHGELGPVLVAAGDHFRDAKDVRHDLGQHMSAADRAAGEIRVLKGTLAGLQQRAAAGEDVAAALNYQRDRLDALRKIAAAAA